MLRSVETGVFECDTLVHCQKKPGVPGATVIENALLKRPVLAPKALKTVVDLLKSKREPWWGALPLFVLGSSVAAEGAAGAASDDDDDGRTATEGDEGEGGKARAEGGRRAKGGDSDGDDDGAGESA